MPNLRFASLIFFDPQSWGGVAGEGGRGGVWNWSTLPPSQNTLPGFQNLCLPSHTHTPCPPFLSYLHRPCFSASNPSSPIWGSQPPLLDLPLHVPFSPSTAPAWSPKPVGLLVRRPLKLSISSSAPCSSACPSKHPFLQMEYGTHCHPDPRAGGLSPGFLPPFQSHSTPPPRPAGSSHRTFFHPRTWTHSTNLSAGHLPGPH